jgi:hypothetical protein
MLFHGNNGYANAPQYYVYAYIGRFVECNFTVIALFQTLIFRVTVDSVMWLLVCS